MPLCQRVDIQKSEEVFVLRDFITWNFTCNYSAKDGHDFEVLCQFFFCNVLGGYTILMPMAIIATRYFACGDNCFAIFAFGDIYFVIFAYGDNDFVTLCLRVQKMLCKTHMRRLFNYQLSIINCVQWLTHLFRFRIRFFVNSCFKVISPISQTPFSQKELELQLCRLLFCQVNL